VSSREELAELGATAILKRTAPAWWWLRKNFTLPAVVAIAGILITSATWLWTQHTDIRDLKRDMAELKKKPGTEAFEQRVNTLELDRAALPPRLNAIEARVAAQEHEWQVVHDAAAHSWSPRGAAQSGRSANRPGR
jgi:hypothetical protein